MIKKWLVAAPLLAMSSMALAGNIPDLRLALDDPCGVLEVVHINGMKNSVPQAQANLFSISGAYGNGHNNHVIKYKLAYNQTSGVIGDLVETWQLKLRQDPLLTFEVFLRITAGLQIPTATQDKMFKEVAAMWNAASLKAYAVTDPAVAAVALYIAGPGTGSPTSPHTSKKVFVAHSQGSLMALAVRDRFIQGINIGSPMPAESITIVSIAAAAGEVKGLSASHSTSTNDLVIGALRTFTVPIGFSVLGSNITIAPMMADWLGHDLIRIYMAASNGKSAVIAKMKAALTAVKSPSPAPVGYVESFAYTLACGTVASYYSPDAGCFLDVPYMAPAQWYFKPITINFYNTADVPQQLHEFGTYSELAGLTRVHMDACYAAHNADRIDSIKTGLGQYEPWHLVAPGCGIGWPYIGTFGPSWWVSSGDGTKIVTKEQVSSDGKAKYFWTQKHLTCRVATN